MEEERKSVMDRLRSWMKPNRTEGNRVGETRSVHHNRWQATSKDGSVVQIQFNKAEIETLVEVAHKRKITVFKAIRKACYTLINNAARNKPIKDDEFCPQMIAEEQAALLDVELESRIVNQLNGIATANGLTVEDTVRQACRNMISFDFRTK